MSVWRSEHFWVYRIRSTSWATAICLEPRWRSTNVEVIAARDDGRLIGSNVVTRWGSFGFFGPLTVLPEYWDRGVAQRLLESTMTVFDKWGVRHTGLFTFPASAKHIGLVPQVRLLAALSHRLYDAHAGCWPDANRSAAAIGFEKIRERSGHSGLRTANEQDRQRTRSYW